MEINEIQRPIYTKDDKLDELLCYLEGRDVKSISIEGKYLVLTLYNGKRLTVKLSSGGCCYEAGNGIDSAKFEEKIIETNANLSEIITDILVSGSDIGSYSNGDIIPKGTSVEEIIKKIVTKTIDVYPIKPYSKISLIGDVRNNNTYEVGSDLEVILNTQYIDGKFIGKEGYYSDGRQYEINAGCNALTVTYLLNNTVIYRNIPIISKQYNISNLTEKKYLFESTISYGDSTVQPKKNDGSNSSVKIENGVTEKTSASITGSMKYFYGCISLDDYDSGAPITSKEDLRIKNLTSGFCVNNSDTIIKEIQTTNSKPTLVLVLPHKYSKIKYTENSMNVEINVDEKWKKQTNNDGTPVSFVYTNGEFSSTYDVFFLYSFNPIIYKNIKFGS